MCVCVRARVSARACAFPGVFCSARRSWWPRGVGELRVSHLGHFARGGHIASWDGHIGGDI